ncbi:unnamed protein product, partial [Ectocarpus sp. 12 AP-2014]
MHHVKTCSKTSSGPAQFLVWLTFLHHGAQQLLNKNTCSIILTHPSPNIFHGNQTAISPQNFFIMRTRHGPNDRTVEDVFDARHKPQRETTGTQGSTSALRSRRNHHNTSKHNIHQTDRPKKQNKPTLVAGSRPQRSSIAGQPIKQEQWRPNLRRPSPQKTSSLQLTGTGSSAFCWSVALGVEVARPNRPGSRSGGCRGGGLGPLRPLLAAAAAAAAIPASDDDAFKRTSVGIPSLRAAVATVAAVAAPTGVGRLLHSGEVR